MLRSKAVSPRGCGERVQLVPVRHRVGGQKPGFSVNSWLLLLYRSQKPGLESVVIWHDALGIDTSALLEAEERLMQKPSRFGY